MRLKSAHWGPISVIVLVAVLVVIVGLGTADDDAPGNATIAATTTTTIVTSTSSVPFDPLAQNFCVQTESARSAIGAIAVQISAPSGETPSNTPMLVAQLFETVDLAQLEVDEMPESLRDDITTLVTGRDQAVQDLRAAPPDANVVTILSPEMIIAGNQFVEYSRAYCS